MCGFFPLSKPSTLPGQVPFQQKTPPKDRAWQGKGWTVVGAVVCDGPPRPRSGLKHLLLPNATG